MAVIVQQKNFVFFPFLGSGPDRGQSLADWGEILSIRPSICPTGALLSGPQALLASPQAPLSGPQALLAGPQAPLPGTQAPL